MSGSIEKGIRTVGIINSGIHSYPFIINDGTMKTGLGSLGNLPTIGYQSFNDPCKFHTISRNYSAHSTSPWNMMRRSRRFWGTLVGIRHHHLFESGFIAIIRCVSMTLNTQSSSVIQCKS